ncbi:hypothetical protein OCF84_09095 [Shewanella xiamenensis]|uniref:hypothetical protein n=1 Tax=Shewanella xiamenensis TaxID=332186 RepID=UPI00214FA3A6|nr:hypothetical protein [Shewanella xiamenensis]MCR4536745.1 hypothetical protein [Shewanella xiamenensis]WHF57343.1 hypothetical protein OCF84_09095 [Shewanella xiamenensis]
MSTNTAKINVTTSKLSAFVMNASSAEKKRVYTQVIKKATESQNKMIIEAKSMAM